MPQAILGRVENVMYAVALLVGKGEFLLAWVALKAAFQWPGWNREPPEHARDKERREAENEGRRVYYYFLIANAAQFIAAALTVVAWRRWGIR